MVGHFLDLWLMWEGPAKTGGASPEHQGSPLGVCKLWRRSCYKALLHGLCFGSTSQFLLELLLLAALDDGRSPVPRPELFPL